MDNEKKKSETEHQSPAWALVVTVAIIVGLAWMFWPTSRSQSPESASNETYRLVHAIGNDENVAAKGLSKAECETRKQDLKASASKLGMYDEATGFGSITCLPESLFTN